MTKMSNRIAPLIAVLLLNISCLRQPYYACPRATPEQDAKAKEFLSAPDKSVIYVYRLDSAGSILFSVSIDGRESIDLISRSYIRVELSPGMHEVIISTPKKNSKISFGTEAGKLYFLSHVWGYVSNPVGLPFLHFRDPAKLKIQLQPEEDGRAEIQGLKLLSSSGRAKYHAY